MADIHTGVALRKIDREKLRAEQDANTQNSVGALCDLQGVLSRALDERAKAIFGEDDDFDDWDDDWDDDDF